MDTAPKPSEFRDVADIELHIGTLSDASAELGVTLEVQTMGAPELKLFHALAPGG